jgi:hypothetical protein
MNDNGSIFTKYIADPPVGIAELSQAQKLQPAQMLLTWLQRWKKDVISERDIRIYGPRPLRSKESASAAAEVLVRNGWLSRRKMPRHDSRGWKVIRKPILDPTVAT